MLNQAITSVGKYLLIPSIPTPNGRMHLGHIGGPYLRADILARHLRMLGHKAYIACGLDSYDSYTVYQAFKEQRPPLTINNDYYTAILDDLADMDIHLDIMINPIDNAWGPRYQHWCRLIFSKLERKGALVAVREKMLWDKQRHAYLIGCWLVGQCPYCKLKAESYFCESCGAHFKPEEILSPRARTTPQDDIERVDILNLFMKILAPNIEQLKGVNSTIYQNFQTFLTKQDSLMRMTTPNPWGIALTDRQGYNYMFFNYGFVFAYFLMLGEKIAELDRSCCNAFAKDSSFTTIASFGMDNAIPFLASVYGITSHCKQFKPFDAYLINYFYQLDESKFSTSRQHAIWAASAIRGAKLSSDIIRLYLASIAVDTKPGSFVTEDFLKFYNTVVGWLNDCVKPALARLANATRLSTADSLLNRLDSLLEKQVIVLDYSHYQPQLGVSLIKEWIEMYPSLDSVSAYYWWLKGLSLLTYPFMPKFSTALWEALMANSTPSLQDFLTITPLNLAHYQYTATPITKQEIQVLRNNSSTVFIKE
jgi:methionyl-tRNA synthetase